MGGVDEGSLWVLAAALDVEKRLEAERQRLQDVWQATSLADPSLGTSIRKANSLRMLSRVARRLKAESESVTDSIRLASALLNAPKNGHSEIAELAKSTEAIENADAAIEGLDEALARRLSGDPRLVGAAVRWLTKHAKIRIVRISDPHGEAEPAKPEKKKKGKKKPNAEEQSDAPETLVGDAPVADVAAAAQVPEPAVTSEPAVTLEPAVTPKPAVTAESAAPTETRASVDADPRAEQPGTEPAVAHSGDAEPAASETSTSETSASETSASETSASETSASEASTGEVAPPASPAREKVKPLVAAPAAMPGSPKAELPKPEPESPKKPKKLSPRQRRRKWLVSVLKNLSGKTVDASKLSAFQIVMLARALRSSVAECEFRYDATKLVSELQHAAGSIHNSFAGQLQQVVLQHEALIREAAEAAWWEDLQERASARLVSLSADQLRHQVNRGGIDAKRVLAIDAVGPKTAAATIVQSDGRVLHTEDLPCGLGKGPRAAAVARMGELIHHHHVDLIVVSNGPARRGVMIALADLVAQSPEGSIRYTLAERSGGDAYAGGSLGDAEMRSTPRRFRAAAWLAFSVLQPAQALAKVEPLKLRLNAFAKELSENALSSALEDILISGASRGGVDVNSTPVSWLARLPGMSADTAKAIDEHRRGKLFKSRMEIDEGGFFESHAQRQVLPFLRVFHSEEKLDGTLIHPDDYGLATRLAKVLEIEMPPEAPPGYELPDYTVPDATAKDVELVDSTPPPEKPAVEDFTQSAVDSADFKLGEAAVTESTPTEMTTEDSPTDEVASEDSDATPGVAENTVAENTGGGDADVAGEETQVAAESAEAAVESAEVAADSTQVATDTDANSDASEATPTTAESAPSGASETTDPPESTIVRRPLPDPAKVDKCVKEWQVGGRRAHQIVHWLCDPFGDGDVSAEPAATMNRIASLTNLKPGDPVVGVVVGMMPFGVFVELAPDCSGLVHISRVSDSYVEDLHEVVSVGDIVSAWVTGIDDKHRRVSLSLISPAREAELENQRAERRSEGRGRGGPGRGGPGRDHSGRGRGRGRDQGGRQQGGHNARQPAARGGNAAGSGAPAGRGGPNRGGESARGGGGPGRGKDQRAGGRGRDQRSGGGRDTRGGGRGRDSRGRKSRAPESYRVESKVEVKPLTEAMQSGAEPLRSFGDLA
ncbi:MAG: S1 RNA-binding domain-containing protein, partial [Planctomycetota bacterium]